MKKQIKDTSRNWTDSVLEEGGKIKDVIESLNLSSSQVALVVGKNKKFIGIITDGDLRRMLAKTENFTNLSAIDIMTKNPKSIDINAMAVDAMQLMEKHQITQLLVTDNEMYAGVIHLHDLMKEGIL